MAGKGKTAKYKVKFPIERDGKRFEPGSFITVDETEYSDLKECLVVPDPLGDDATDAKTDTKTDVPQGGDEKKE